MTLRLPRFHEYVITLAVLVLASCFACDAEAQTITREAVGADSVRVVYTETFKRPTNPADTAFRITRDHLLSSRWRDPRSTRFQLPRYPQDTARWTPIVLRPDSVIVSVISRDSVRLSLVVKVYGGIGSGLAATYGAGPVDSVSAIPQPVTAGFPLTAYLRPSNDTVAVQVCVKRVQDAGPLIYASDVRCGSVKSGRPRPVITPLPVDTTSPVPLPSGAAASSVEIRDVGLAPYDPASWVVFDVFAHDAAGADVVLYNGATEIGRREGYTSAFTSRIPRPASGTVVALKGCAVAVGKTERCSAVVSYAVP
jgi:hypothetical protein